MFNFLRRLFSSEQVNYKQLLADGAVIIDVRTAGEFNTGHIHGSINIPLHTLESGLTKLDKQKTIILCCASGMRSSSAKRVLQQHNFQQVYDAGSWQSLKKYTA